MPVRGVFSLLEGRLIIPLSVFDLLPESRLFVCEKDEGLQHLKHLIHMERCPISDQVFEIMRI